MRNLLTFLTLFIIATIPLPFAAVQPWVWSFYTLMMIVHYILSSWTWPLALPQRSGSAWTKPGLAVFFAWSLLLCFPLPPSALTFLTPVRAEILLKSWELSGQGPSWQSISYLPRNGFGWWVFLLSLLLFYRAMRRLCDDRKTLKYIVFVMIAVGIGEAIYGLVQALVPSMGVLWVDYVHAYMGSARGTFINRNNFAGLIEMIWPLALGIALSMAGRINSIKMILNHDRLNRQALVFLLIIVLLLALIFSRSRAGILSGVFGFLVFFIMARPEMRKRSKQIRMMIAGAVVLLGFYTLTIGVGSVTERFMDIASGGISRISIWGDSLPIIKDHPLGIGLRNYENVMGIYNQRGAPDKTIVYAHNDYLQLLIETGWVGFVSLVGVGLVFVIRNANRIRHLDYRADPMGFYLAVGAFSGIVSIGVHSLVDFNLQIPANCVYFVVLMAILSACTTPEKSPETPTSRTTIGN